MLGVVDIGVVDIAEQVRDGDRSDGGENQRGAGVGVVVDGPGGPTSREGGHSLVVDAVLLATYIAAAVIVIAASRGRLGQGRRGAVEADHKEP